jgi:hypothetical protein
MSVLRVSVALVLLSAAPAGAADPPVRKPLNTNERAALLALINAVDLAQETDVVSPFEVDWTVDVLKANDFAYVPFRLDLGSVADVPKNAAMYVRVVSRHDGYRSTEESSSLRDWVMHGGSGPPEPMRTVVFAVGEAPLGGVAAMSGRQATVQAAQASAILAQNQKQFEREKAAADAARKRAETRQRDPYRFPFEDYYFFDLKGGRIDRALSVPPGDYDVFVGFVDRGRVKTSEPKVIHRTIAVPDFWNLELAMTNLMLVGDVRALSAALKPQDQADHPYTWGRVEVQRSSSSTFTRDDVLSVVYQICNYAAPDTDIVAEYTFYHRVDGRRTAFNHTDPQHLTNDDLPPPSNWQTQGFVMQRVPLTPFAPGEYELDVVVKDRLLRATATQSIAFTVK